MTQNVWEQEAVKDLVQLEEGEFNLCDFALFLSVMKNETAHRNVLSIIMGEKDLELKEVHVEEVLLNRRGQRAIRLDARATDRSGRNFATEMQNDTEQDDMRRRARFYQGLMDTPVLKSGRETRYKYLPPTIITFITQKDIFGKDLAKYTFTEQCEEIKDLHLEDGTTKIFLNMSSKNGEPVLVSLLQYMKHTTLKNPEILVLLRGPSVKNNLSHTGHCVVTGQGWEKLRLERGGLALHSYRFYFWFECVSKGVASPIMHRNRRCPSLLFSWLLSWKQRAYVPESQSSSS